MADYLRWTAAVLIGLILSLVISKQSKDMSLLLTLAVCVLVCLGALEFLEPVAELLRELRRLGGLDSEAVSILMKAALIGLLSELMGLICADVGEGALGKALQLLSNAAVLWLSIPLLRQLITMVGEVLAEI
ncbi:MAG: hypothetical protein J6I89_06025 [Oscillospiraceae bacterium]|nr:hypothetical protein [Oscillospiraceae bacterium]